MPSTKPRIFQSRNFAWKKRTTLKDNRFIESPSTHKKRKSRILKKILLAFFWLFSFFLFSTTRKKWNEIKTFIFRFSFSEIRLRIEFIAGKSVLLEIKSVQLEDEDLYFCEITYIEPIETCDTSDEYKINLSVVVPPSIVSIMHKDGTVIRNGSTIGPLKEGHRLETICVVRGARPMPIIGWYRNSKKLTHQVISSDEQSGLFDIQSNLSLTLSRHELGSNLECRIQTTPTESILSMQIYIDLEVRPTKIHLSGVKSHVVAGSRVLLQCQVLGGRPAANVSWYNSSILIDESSELTTISTTAVS